MRASLHDLGGCGRGPVLRALPQTRLVAGAVAKLLGCLDAAMVIATHDLDFATSLCTRFLMLDRGQLVFDGKDPDEVKRRWEA